jgi:hypothetical protein
MATPRRSRHSAPMPLPRHWQAWGAGMAAAQQPAGAVPEAEKRKAPDAEEQEAPAAKAPRGGRAGKGKAAA